jgi:serine phosphatase RsbU (regulator of sigma subunit)
MSTMSTARRFHRLPLAILLAGLALFVVLAIACRSLFDQTEDRLLQQRTNEASLILTTGVADTTAPLDAAVALAVVTDGDVQTFTRLIEPYVGDGKPFTSVVLYRIGDVTPVVTVGPAPALSADGSARADAMLTAAATKPFVIVDLLNSGKRRLGYSVADKANPPTYVAYGERMLSDNPNVRRRTEQPFAGLDYAIYLGDTVSSDKLLGASLQELPITGRHATATVPFGDTSLSLVMKPAGHLGGWLFASLWWIVLVVGAAVAVIFAGLTRRLLARRDTALSLAGDNERLYDEQRQIAQSLQISLLPQHLDAPGGTEVAARYWPAGSANLIGGDFYDVFRVDEHRWGVTIGDVCGKGIEAAGLTGLARHTIRAAARHEHSAAAVLRAVHVGLGDQRPATFCTACFLYLTPHDRTITVDLSLGGHPQPILRRASGDVGLVGAPGTLLGMVDPVLTGVTLTIEPGDMLILYTDGLTDAPGEQAVPIEQVVQLVAERGDVPIEQLADEIRVLKRSRRPAGSSDDTALVIVRFGGDDPRHAAVDQRTPVGVGGTAPE